MFRPHWVCPAQGCLCFPVYTAQAPGCSIWSWPCVECGSSLPAPHKARTRLRLRFVPSLAGAAQAARSLTGSLSPGAVRLLPSVAPASVSAHAGRVSGSLPIGTRACLPVGEGGFSGAEFAPCPSPCLLPPAGMGLLFSGVSQPLCFANRRRCVPAG